MLDQWKSVVAMSGAQFVNLQYGDMKHELSEMRPLTVHHWDDCDPLRDLDDFAALTSALDLVISVDNATVHLAGALGVPVWILLPWEADWRWMRDRDNSPWYPTARLFRQPQPKDWSSVFAHVANELKTKFALNNTT